VGVDHGGQALPALKKNRHFNVVCFLVMSFVVRKLKLLNFQWELLTGLYMLEPWEKLLFNSIVIVILAAVVFASNELVANVGQLVYPAEKVGAPGAPGAAGGARLGDARL
jgi:hypothetical protein